MRGDGPRPVHAIALSSTFSPHAWGWSVRWLHVYVYRIVFPTCVGMVRMGIWRGGACTRFPHMRGDGPGRIVEGGFTAPFSPHAWGWSALKLSNLSAYSVFPTCVGMVRYPFNSSFAPSCFPHMRGDGPATNMSIHGGVKFSPHAWGWSVCARSQVGGGAVFPTCVGMVRARRHTSSG